MNNTTTWQKHDSSMEGDSLRSTPATDPQTPNVYRWLPVHFSQLAMALVVVTTPISFYDPIGNLHRSGASTRLVEMRPRRRRFVTMAMARQIALQALEDARRERAEERLEEAQLNNLRWNNEDFS